MFASPFQFLATLLLVAVLPSGVVSATAAAAVSANDDGKATENDNTHHNNYKACPHCDRIHKLPGYNAPLPSDWYSGYLSYKFHGRIIHTHYMLIEAEFDDDDDPLNPKKPLIYWSNGGPGASSMFGLFTELGPLQWNELSLQTDDYKRTGIPTPMYNPYSWSRLGSLLIFDAPAPVGFSYCTPAENTTTSYDEPQKEEDEDEHSNLGKTQCAGLGWNDELASENAKQAMLAFYQAYPHYKESDLYLTGESYAGIYIPTLAREILNYNEEIGPDSDDAIPLQGFAVGDGCLGTETGICGIIQDDNSDWVPDYWNILFLAGHHQMPMQSFHDILRACHPHLHNGRLAKTSVCKAAVDKALAQVGGFFEYSLYDECIYSNGLLTAGQHETLPVQDAAAASNPFMQGALNDYACGGIPVMLQYLDMPEVKQALHVTSDFYMDDNAVDFDYTPTEKDLTAFYEHVATDTGLKVLVYNGDTDPAITSFAAQNWTSHLKLKETEAWRPWTTDSCQRVEGYVTRYAGEFDFLTIRGAGHMVPTYKPEATYTFLKAWIEGTNYPTYDSSCKLPPARMTSSRGTTPAEEEEPSHLLRMEHRGIIKT